VFTTQYKIALGRVSDFCTRPEVAPAPKNAAQKVSIKMKDVSLAWTTEQPILEGIDMKVKQGEVVMVVGAVGCGKSTLCQAVLQEIPHVTGEVEVNGQLAYVPQEAWIFNARYSLFSSSSRKFPPAHSASSCSVRDNILFGKPFDEKLYTKVLKMAALGPDLDILPARDMTHIGDRGTNLSGGQKQRVSIARALYADKDVYVFDDPFSAVDSHVAKHLVENAVVKFVRGTGKTAFVATNQLQFLPYANRVIMLQNGRVVANGAFDKLMQDGGAFAALVKEFGVFEEMDEDESSTQSRKHVKSENTSAHVVTNQKKDEDAAEERETGTIGFGTYWNYIKSGGLGIFLFSLILMFVIGGVRVYYALWLSDWSSTDPAVSGRHVRDTWIGVYVGLILIECVLVPIRLVPIIFWGRNASRVLHQGLLSSVIRATTSFFDLTPSGRIISRFSKDMNMIDELLSFQVDQYVQLAVSLLALLAQMAASQPYILIVIGVGLIIFLLLQRAFQKTAVDIQRCEALSRAPILSHLTESIEGAASIRAYGLNKNFNVANFNKVGVNIANWMSLRYSIAWFGMRLDWIGSVIILATYLGVFLSRNYTTFTAATLSLAAVAMSSTSNITFLLSAVANNAVELETKMNAVERVKQYSHIEQEPPAHIEETKPDAAWPHKGKITFKNLSIAYKGGKRVLDDISGSLKPREKVGIVGRTGAGKSTLITALFRLVEPVDGTINIDGVDIRTLGLADLRRRLAIIPQTPQMVCSKFAPQLRSFAHRLTHSAAQFIGDLRYNLDPFNEKEDKDIWNALEMVNLKPFVESLEGKLQAPVEENGSNYSVGQRQLLAMARALLLDAKILLLDEATAAVDNEADALIQTMVRRNFKNRTVLTIAHRLNTIMDYDRVMVLDKGKLVEFDSPKNLLDDPKTIFSSMVEATGDASAAHLRRIARGEVVASTEVTEKKKKSKPTESKKSKSKKQRN
jgi:ABC-type multidrug transport system fused ATPase/permease subunit